MANRPFFSIVIANYNYGRYLGDAISSVLGQSFTDFELLVVDGGSTDNSKNVILSYQDKIAWWCSEPDQGQSNAFNKGFSHASGRFLTWLNADDILLPDTLNAVYKKLTDNPWADWATGNFIRFRSSDMAIISAPCGPFFLPSWLQGAGRMIPVYGPTAFWKKDVYEKLGVIDETLHYTMDVEYWSRLTMAGYKQVRVNHYCWGFRMHEQSKTAEFDGHERSVTIKDRMDFERRYISEKTGHSVSFMYRVIGLVCRILDGSAFVALYNKIFLVGSVSRKLLSK